MLQFAHYRSSDCYSSAKLFAKNPSYILPKCNGFFYQIRVYLIRELLSKLFTYYFIQLFFNSFPKEGPSVSKLITSFGVLILLISLVTTPVLADSEAAWPNNRPRLEWEIEYLTPYDKDRQIDTISFNALRQSGMTKSGWNNYRGITLTRAWGEINRTTIDPDSSAFGIGPTFLTRKALWQQGKAIVYWDASVALIFYSQDFPAGGDFYNFMWRLGPKLTYAINTETSWEVAYKAMHVSNGQISHRDPSPNPSYNAGGFTVGILRRY